MDGKGHPGRVHGISERLWRVGSEERLRSMAEPIEDEGDLKPMARPEAPIELG